MQNKTMRSYLDLCCFNRPYDDQSQVRVRLETEAKLSLQDKVRSGECTLVWSAVLDLENSKKPVHRAHASHFAVALAGGKPRHGRA
jgi:hypothetical protein